MSNFFAPATSHLAIPRAPLRIAQQQILPANDGVTEATYAAFPLTVGAIGDLYASRVSTWSGIAQHRIYANRATGGHSTKDNVCQPSISNGAGVSCQMRFSTITKANAATACRLSNSAGYAEYEADGVSGWGDIRDAAGLTTCSWQTAHDNTATLFTGTGTSWVYSLDLVVLTKLRLVDLGTTGPKEMSLDYEPQDSRTAAQTSAIVAQCVALARAKGFKFTLYTNPLDGLGATPYNGINATNFDSLLAAVDYFNILIYSGSPSGNVLTSFNAQIAKFANPDFTKMQVTWGLDCTPADAVVIRDQMRLHGFAGVEFWLNGATLGGDCSTNAAVVSQIATLVGVPGC